MIHLITKRQNEYKHLLSSSLRFATIGELDAWLSVDNIYQLDTETTMVDDGPDQWEDRKLLLIQIGDKDKKNQFLIDHTMFEDNTLQDLFREYFETPSTRKRFIAHSASFEYKMIKKTFDIRVENLEDTYLMSKVLNSGLELERGYHSLKSCVKRFLDVDLSKEQQTTFTEDVMTLEQIEYAATDVVFMYDLWVKMYALIKGWKSTNTYSLERQVLKVYADMELGWMNFDHEAWGALSDHLKQENVRIEAELNQLVISDPKLVDHLKNSALVIKETLIQPKDQLKINWASNNTRKHTLQTLIPSLANVQSFSKPKLKKMIKEGVIEGRDARLLQKYLDRDYEFFDRYIMLYYRDWAEQSGYYVKKDTILINWSSNVHKLYIFRFYYPNLTDTNMKSLARIYKNPLINKFKEYSKVHKSLTTYGPKFPEKYCRRDGTIAPQGVNQILNTGRVSFGILLQLPAKAEFRNAFLPPYKDWVFVDTDYSSAEVAIFASAAGETAFIDAIKEGRDLHMMSASLLFADKWEEIAEPGCTHLIDGSRCSCKSHNELRQKSKAITFGLAYGLGPVGLAERLDITKTEAMELMDNFFKVFNHLKAFFQQNSEFGIENHYIRGLEPVGRVRFFHPPANEGEKAAIGRQSQNYKIQEANASMLKIALVNMRKYIIEHDFPAKLVLPIHDETLSAAHKDRAEEWLEIQERIMREAADKFLEPGLLGVDSKITERWTK